MTIVAATLLLVVLWLFVQAWFRMFDDMLGARKIRNRFWQFVRSENQKEQASQRHLPHLNLNDEAESDR